MLMKCYEVLIFVICHAANVEPKICILFSVSNSIGNSVLGLLRRTVSLMQRNKKSINSNLGVKCSLNALCGRD